MTSKTIVYYIVCIDELLKVKQLIDKKVVADF